jgi:hypothetical protein
MELDSVQIRLCPYCKEEINAEATKCKHCKSYLQSEKPSHGGICPYCKEEIKPDAIKCKHCESFVGPETNEFLSNRAELNQRTFRSGARILSANIRKPTQFLTGNWPSTSDFDYCEDCLEYELNLGSYSISFEDTLCYKAETIVGEDGKPVVKYSLPQIVPCRAPIITYHPDRPIAPPRPLDPKVRLPVPTFVTS